MNCMFSMIKIKFDRHRCLQFFFKIIIMQVHRYARVKPDFFSDKDQFKGFGCIVNYRLTFFNDRNVITEIPY